MSPNPQGQPPPPSQGGLRSRGLASLAGLAKDLPSLPAQALPAGQPLSKADAELATALRGRIVIARELKGRGGKTVTFVRGIEAKQALLETLARELRKELGTGVRVEEGALVAQGALSERLAACLARRGAARIVIGN